jgi:hypothetical protein
MTRRLRPRFTSFQVNQRSPYIRLIGPLKRLKHLNTYHTCLLVVFGVLRKKIKATNDDNYPLLCSFVVCLVSSSDQRGARLSNVSTRFDGGGLSTKRLQSPRLHKYVYSDLSRAVIRHGLALKSSNEISGRECREK